MTEAEWYGKNLRVSPANKFNDIKRGVDKVLEVSRITTEDQYLGLGIDVTYNGLMSEKYRDKFERLLETIRLGQKTKLKYFKNQKGELMSEFVVPKIVLHFDGNDVKELAHFVKHLDEPGVKETFANSQMKISVLNQVLVQCQLLADFAKECGNSIEGKYREIVSAISELGQKNPDIQSALESHAIDETTKRLTYVLSKFKELEMAA